MASTSAETKAEAPMAAAAAGPATNSTNTTATDTAASASTSTSTSNLPIHTYHCICTHLLFASTLPLTALPRRAKGNAADGAYILPLPPLPRPRAAEGDDDDEEGEGAGEGEEEVKKEGTKETGAEAAKGRHFALLLGTLLDRRPQIVRSENGFEKRYLQRCGRCAVVVGYQLDWSQWTGVATGAGTVAGGGDAAVKTGRRTDVVYLLPGGLLATEEMARGKDVSAEVAVLGQG